MATWQAWDPAGLSAPLPGKGPGCLTSHCIARSLSAGLRIIGAETGVA